MSALNKEMRGMSPSQVVAHEPREASPVPNLQKNPLPPLLVPLFAAVLNSTAPTSRPHTNGEMQTSAQNEPCPKQNLWALIVPPWISDEGWGELLDSNELDF